MNQLMTRLFVGQPQLHRSVKYILLCDAWHVTCDMWLVTCDMWLVTYETWPVTGWRRWTFSQNFNSIALTAWDLEVTCYTLLVTPDIFQFIFDECDKKIIKYFAKKKFKGVQMCNFWPFWTPYNFFLAKCFIIFLSHSWIMLLKQFLDNFLIFYKIKRTWCQQQFL